VPQVLANGIRAAYNVAGEGPDVVLVHGWMASKRYWQEASRKLPGFRVWALDLYGFGDSEKPANGYTLEGYAAFLEGYLDTVGIRKAAIIGHSMGGAVVAWTAIRSPERFWALGLVDAALTGITGPPPAWTTEPVMRMFMRIADTSRGFGRLTIKGMFGVSEPESRIMLEEAQKADVYSAAASGSMMSKATDWGGLGKLKVPALVVYGEDDFLVARGMDREIESLLRVKVDYLEDCGHLPMLEQPKAFYDTLAAFLEEHKPK